jgi:hypothetical protein
MEGDVEAPRIAEEGRSQATTAAGRRAVGGQHRRAGNCARGRTRKPRRLRRFPCTDELGFLSAGRQAAPLTRLSGVIPEHWAPVAEGRTFAGEAPWVRASSRRRAARPCAGQTAASTREWSPAATRTRNARRAPRTDQGLRCADRPWQRAPGSTARNPRAR